MLDLSNRTFLITGAARGIGAAIATEFAQAGAAIALSDVNQHIPGLDYETGSATALAETAAQIRQNNPGAKIITASVDVRNYDQLRDLAARAKSEFGTLDGAIANAGIASWPTSTWQASEEQWQTMLDVNLTGAWNTARAVIPEIMDGGRGGSILFMSSTAGLKPVATIGHYAAAKAGQIGLMKALALELAPHSIRVNTIHPGGTGTEMTQNPAAEHWQATAPGVSETLALPLPIHRMETTDVAHLARWLVSDEARYITGTTQVLDAGALLR